MDMNYKEKNDFTEIVAECNRVSLKHFKTLRPSVEEVDKRIAYYQGVLRENEEFKLLVKRDELKESLTRSREDFEDCIEVNAKYLEIKKFYEEVELMLEELYRFSSNQFPMINAEIYGYWKDFYASEGLLYSTI